MPRLTRTRFTVLLTVVNVGLIVALLSIGPAASAGAHSGDGPRLVVLSPAISITLRDLGYAHLIVGRHAFDSGVASSAPVCGDQTQIDYQTILSLNPTHVIIEWGSRDPPELLAALAGDHGWRVMNLNALTLDDVAQVADVLDSALAPLAAPRDRLVQGSSPSEWFLSHVDQRHTDLSGTGRVLLLHNAVPPMAFGRGSAHYELLERIGAQPALGDSVPSYQLDSEGVWRLSPDSIVLIDPRPPGTPPRRFGTQDVLAMLGPLADLDIPAVRLGRVHVIDDPDALMPSTSFVRLADQLVDVLSGRDVGGGGP